jgi:hypothetical protein
MDYEGAPLKGQPVPVSPQAPAAIKHEWPEASAPNPCGANEVVANLTPNLKNGLILAEPFPQHTGFSSNNVLLKALKDGCFPIGFPMFPGHGFLVFRKRRAVCSRLRHPPSSPYLWRYLARIAEKPAPAASFANAWSRRKITFQQ